MDIVRTLFAKFGELIIERWSHFHRQAFHDVLHQRLGEGNAVKVLLVVEVLHDDQVGLESFNLGREVFSDLLD